MRWRLLRRQLYGQINIMPNRYIEIPAAVPLLDPSTGKPIPDENGKDQSWDFDFVMHKLMSNPIWGESYAAMRSQDAIHDAWKNAKDGVVTLPEEDWKRLKDTAESPRTTVSTPMGNQAMPGFGVHPMLARCLVPLLSAIVNASDKPPKAKEAEPPAPPPKPEPPKTEPASDMAS